MSVPGSKKLLPKIICGKDNLWYFLDLILIFVYLSEQISTCFSAAKGSFEALSQEVDLHDSYETRVNEESLIFRILRVWVFL